MATPTPTACCFCSDSIDGSYRVCRYCVEGGKDIRQNVAQMPEVSREFENNTSKQARKWSYALPRPKQNLADAATKIRLLKDALKSSEQAAQTACKRSTYLNELVEAFRRRFHEDLELVTDDGLSLRAHRVILTSRSEVFKSMLEMDSDTHEKCLKIRYPDMGHNELKLFIEFIYSGQMTVEDLKDHASALLMAADKYDIALLKEICETYFVQTLTASNALEVLVLAARLSSSKVLEEAALSTIAKNYKLITLSNEYEKFAVKNPLLSVKVSRSIIDKI